VRKKAPKQPPITKTVDTEYVLTKARKGAKLKEEVWETADGEVLGYSLAYINHRIWAWTMAGCLDTTTATITTIGTSWGR
jgi:hypothetical protein